MDNNEWKAVPSRSGASWAVESGLRVVATGLSEREAHTIAAAPAFAEATAKWLQFYDSCVRDKTIGDEPGIAELRAALASIDAP